MQHTCSQCSSAFAITDDDLAFLDKVSPVFNGKKELIPQPTLCPDCRLQRRLSHRNEKNLYHRKCDTSGKQIISMHAPNKPFRIYHQQEWWGDDWDPQEYAQEFEFSRPFFEQFQQLQHAVPRMALQQENNENSDYTMNVSNLKNCYLLFSSDFSQDCSYGIWVERCQDSIDNFMIDECQWTYESIFSNKIYHSGFVYFSSNCSDCSFLIDCIGCKDCLMCWGLRNKQYCIGNEQYSKEEYEKKRAEFPLNSQKNLCDAQRHFSEILLRIPHPPMRKHGSISNSTGNLLTDVHNCINCYELVDGRDCKNTIGFKIKDSMDCTYVHGELAYENCECFPTPYQSAFNINCYSGSDLYYCDLCMNDCKNCFGCVGLKHKQYCILNKQYSKEDYEALAPRIIAHMQTTNEWGEFFPTSLSPFGYNESEAYQHFPLKREKVNALGWHWYEEQEKEDNYLGPNYDIPDSITDVPEEITKQILKCEVTGKPYKIIPQELKFYRDMGIPIPRKCPDQRHKERMALRNPRKLWNRKCQKCEKDIQTTYAPERPEIVYCESCYLSSVY